MDKKVVHVAVAVIRDTQNQILLAKRSLDQHQGGLWEFPGGKVETNETVEAAVVREIKEELGIDVFECQPLIQIPHHYPDKSVFLDVYEVLSFTGEPSGQEGQPIKWVTADELDNYEFPAANKPIIKACQLPKSIFITPAQPLPQLISQAEKAISLGADAVMLRAHALNGNDYLEAFRAIKELCDRSGVVLMPNRNLDFAHGVSTDFLHLSSHELKKLKSRQLFAGRFLGASCHNDEELQMALDKGVDYVTLSPVLQTQSHPDTDAMGWDKFSDLLSELTLPVYALGGMQPEYLSKAQLKGAQGIAAINAWLAE